MTTRRSFIKKSFLGAGLLMIAPSIDLKSQNNSGIKISLAEWSLHRTIRDGKIDHLDFPAIAKKDFNISAVEYVNGLFGGTKMDFKEAAKNSAYLNELLKRSKDAGVFNHLLMVDDEGPLALPDGKVRLLAVDDHKKWIEAAKLLGCLTVRVNLHGDGTPEAKKAASIDSLSRLGDFAKSMNINIVVENHGHESSNGAWVADVMRQVNRPNVGTLPDFGNFCLSQDWGSTQDECKDYYDRYQGVKEMLPFAKGVSAKTYDFDSNGEQPKMDYKRLIGIVKASGFKGYIGVEFEGNTQPEEEGIRKTKLLIEKYL
ncbi:MAG: sugar phosphate isomerase/epimerase family protein [Bacteroidales bacterium]|jgi:sugar phosphate isomerase/epimerase